VPSRGTATQACCTSAGVELVALNSNSDSVLAIAALLMLHEEYAGVWVRRRLRCHPLRRQFHLLAQISRKNLQIVGPFEMNLEMSFEKDHKPLKINSAASVHCIGKMTQKNISAHLMGGHEIAEETLGITSGHLNVRLRIAILGPRDPRADRRHQKRKCS